MSNLKMEKKDDQSESEADDSGVVDDMRPIVLEKKGNITILFSCISRCIIASVFLHYLTKCPDVNIKRHFFDYAPKDSQIREL